MDNITLSTTNLWAESRFFIAPCTSVLTMWQTGDSYIRLMLERIRISCYPYHDKPGRNCIILPYEQSYFKRRTFNKGRQPIRICCGKTGALICLVSYCKYVQKATSLAGYVFKWLLWVWHLNDTTKILLFVGRLCDWYQQQMINPLHGKSCAIMSWRVVRRTYVRLSIRPSFVNMCYLFWYFAWMTQVAVCLNSAQRITIQF